MRVSNKMIYGHYSYAYAQRESAIHKLDKQISSGKRIEKPSDDPFGTSRAMSYRTSITEVAQYKENSNRAMSWLDITDNALMSIDSYLHRVRELVINGVDDALNSQEKGALAQEVDQIAAGLMQIANTTLDNSYVFAGEKTSEKPYEWRNSVTGRKLTTSTFPNNIDIQAGVNDTFGVSLDNGPLKTITLTPRNYNGSPGAKLQDLVDDIQLKLQGIFPANNVPVNVKATADGKLTFYAGTQPPDLTTHSLVLRQGVNDALVDIGFQDRATTKELIGSKIDFPVMVMGKYDYSGTSTGSNLTTTIVLEPQNGAANDYYNNWTVTVDDPVNGAQTQKITDYVNATNTITVGGWGPNLSSPNVKYYLSPPLTGGGPTVAGGPSTIQIPLANASTVDDFYVGMPITITDGLGENQTRNIVDYVAATGTITVDQPWAVVPGAGSQYAIDAHSYINANNKFRFTIGNELPQEISLDDGGYSPVAFAEMIQRKIRERGTPPSIYDNVQVTITPDNELRIVPQDPVALGNNPPIIRLESGSTADGLWLMGFKNGAVSDEPLPNYEGNRGSIEYEVNVGVRMQINSTGDKLFDPIFKHLTKISMDLRAGNDQALSGDDLHNVGNDLDMILMAQGEIGAKVNRMEKALERFDVINENMNKMLSSYEDTDISQAILDLRMHETAYQAALQSGARIMPLSLLEYLR
ncbi:MAG TPA: flagellar hook-associated protein FlgL [Bacillota bacterium]|nr:flagellar hook-associated protein FlgL [Bacillota bacterium]